MVLKIENKEFFKEVNYKPENDSDAAGDYQDGIDSVDSDKFNRRWNSNNKMLLDMQRFNERITSIIKTIEQMGLLYEGDITKDLLSTFKPFEKQIATALNLDFGVLGMPSVLFINDKENIVLPNGKFVENLEISNEQFAIAVGNTDLFEIQEDTDLVAPPATKLVSNNRWYRLGHTGAESVPAAAIARHTLSSSAVWAVVDVKFEDYQNNPSGKNQIIRIKGNTNNEFIEFVLDPDQTNYRINAALWDGGSLQTYLDQDTGVARSSAEHNILFFCNQHTTEVWLDGSLVFTKTAEVIQNTDVLEFETENDSGSADFFDIQRFNVYETEYFTLTVDNTHYIYVDKTDGIIKSTTTLVTATAGLVLYEIVIPLGATEILASYVIDRRSITEFLNNPKYSNLEITNLSAVDINTVNIDGITADFENYKVKGQNYIITSASEFDIWFAARQSYDTVYLVGEWDITGSTKTFTNTTDHITIIANKNIGVEVQFLIDSDYITLIGLNFGQDGYATIDGTDPKVINCIFTKDFVGSTTQHRLSVGNNAIIEKCLFDFSLTGSDNAVVNDGVLQVNHSGKIIIRDNYFISDTGENEVKASIKVEGSGIIPILIENNRFQTSGALAESRNFFILFIDSSYAIIKNNYFESDLIGRMQFRFISTTLTDINISDNIGLVRIFTNTTTTVNLMRIISNTITGFTIDIVTATVIERNIISSNHFSGSSSIEGDENNITNNIMDDTFTLTITGDDNYIAGNIIDNLTITGSGNIPTPASSNNKIF